jgi:spore germination protein KC
MNALIYGTSGNFEQLLTTNSLFEFSPLFTILLNPIDNFRQYSVLPPVEIREFIAENNRTFRTHVLPSLKINEDAWKNEKAPHPVLEVSGAYLMNSYNFKGFLPISDLLGVRWMTEKTVRANLDFKADGEFLGSLNVMHPKVKIKPTSTTKEQYSVELKMKGTIMDEKMNTPESELDELARRSLIEQVQHTFDKAQRLNADIYNLRDSLFSRNPKAIKRLSLDGVKPLPEDALQLKADVQVVFSGKYKVRAK